MKKDLSPGRAPDWMVIDEDTETAETVDDYTAVSKFTETNGVLMQSPANSKGSDHA